MEGPAPGKAFEEWYKLAAALGAALAIGGSAVGFWPLVQFGSGLCLLGLGEFVNHPYRERPVFGDWGQMIGKIEGRSRYPGLFGLLLDYVGVGLMGVGVYQLATL